MHHRNCSWTHIIISILVLGIGPAWSQPTGASKVADQMARIFDDPAFARAFWGVKVQRLESGEVLFESNAEKLLMPASNLKLVTALATLAHFGPDARFTTEVWAEGPVEEGVVRGDLVIRGSGDPSLGARPLPAEGEESFDPTALLGDWARGLRDAGIRRIEGGLVADTSLFAAEPVGEEWAVGDLPFGYSAEVSALQFNEDVLRLRITPGKAPGDPVAVTVEPATDFISVENRLESRSPGACRCEDSAFSLRREVGNRFILEGTLVAGSDPFVRTIAVEHPSLLFLRLLRRSLEAEGITVGGGDRERAAAPEAGPSPSKLLWAHQSEPLEALLREFLKQSRNLYGEGFLRLLDPRPSGKRVEGGIETAEAFLRSVGVPEGAYQLADGSGLSRTNLLAPEAIIRLLEYAWQRYGDRFRSLLPVGGVDGTIAYRMKATPAEQHVFAKTGTLGNVRALSGYVETREGRLILFSILVNHYTQPRQAADYLADKAMRLLASLK